MAILLDCIRENLRNDYLKLREEKVFPSSTFWNASILDLVEFVLKPPNGGPPSLPEQSDAVIPGFVELHPQHDVVGYAYVADICL